MKFSILPQPVGLLKLTQTLFCEIDIQGREVCLHDFMKKSFSTGLRLDTCDWTGFKLDMVLDVTKFYSMIPLWITLTFSHEATQLFVIID